MKTYIRYEIESRKFSSNVITGIYLHKNDNGKDVEKKDLLITSFLPKKEADVYVQNIYDKMFK